MKQIFSVVLLLSCYCAFCQEHLRFRTIVILKDTLYECYKNGATECIGVDSGMVVTMFGKNIFQLDEERNNILDGESVLFYPDSVIPKEAGHYLKNEKNGKWYYWNKDGTLLRKEIWEKGKLLKSN